jgi:hypothetical protein
MLQYRKMSNQHKFFELVGSLLRRGLKQIRSRYIEIVIYDSIKVLFDILHSTCEEFHVYVSILLTNYTRYFHILILKVKSL